jgi:predicted DNA-binding protein
MSQLQQTNHPKEPTIRLTVDLPESMHRKLSVLAAKTSKKKVEIIRFLLDEALKDVEE